MTADPAQVLFVAMLALLVALATAVLCARSRLAAGLALAAFFTAALLAFLAAAAPGVALLWAIFGVGIVAPLALGSAALLGARAAAPAWRWSAVAIAGVLTALLATSAAQGARLGEESVAANAAGALVMVNRAWGQSGMRDAVQALIANYRAIDALAACGALLIAGFGVYALMGFGERSALRGGDARDGAA